MDVVILGCGEAFDADLPNTSLLINANTRLLVDCGFSAAPQLWKAAPEADALDAIYISHGHADHYFGVPAVLTRMWEEGRTKPLVVVSQDYVLEQLPGVLEAAYRGLRAKYRFPIEHRVARPGDTVEAGDMKLSFAETQHPARNCAVRIETQGRVICYSGDGGFTSASRQLYAGADLLFHEAYSFEPSAAHGDIPGVIRMAREQGVRKLGLVHVARKVRQDRVRLTDAVLAEGEGVSLPEPLSRVELTATAPAGR